MRKLTEAEADTITEREMAMVEAAMAQFTTTSGLLYQALGKHNIPMLAFLHWVRADVAENIGATGTDVDHGVTIGTVVDVDTETPHEAPWLDTSGI